MLAWGKTVLILETGKKKKKKIAAPKAKGQCDSKLNYCSNGGLESISWLKCCIFSVPFKMLIEFPYFSFKNGKIKF